ncbi:4Fe-4S binding protein [Eubacterium oxidoreducens]|uniref:4Fe-4S binding domain-containing protein n=1 Tax=Eubacterium oxidoreducens TaxID=1732 RepID=A0A1G6BT18_EUBOX|nr:4Fe-4S binding protein [Eubacterium oxidoreducens]SDB23773.1 4Fe-4S binding domain-containing protein [Eubacterium oxidoreducens]
MEIKKNKKIRLAISIIIRAVFFFLFPAIFSTAFSGIKYLCTTIISREPFEMNGFLITLIAILLFTIFFGRYFCGYGCVFGTYGDVLYQIASWVRTAFRKKMGKPKTLPKLSPTLGKIFSYGKYAVLLVVVLICLLSDKASQIGTISPWTPFSRLQALQAPAKGSGLAIIFLILISIGMLLVPRFFCRFLCPLGAIFSLLPVLPFSVVTRKKEDCVRGCNLCERGCPADLQLADTQTEERQSMGECFNCSKCAYSCPKSNASAKTMPGGKIGFVWIIVKGAILFAICFYLTKMM